MAEATKKIDVKLAAFGGVSADSSGAFVGGARGRGGAPTPGALVPFDTLNGNFNAIVSTSQVGLDEAPKQAQIDTWVADCKEYNSTVAAWEKMQSQDLGAFNAVLGKNHLHLLQVSPTALTDSACTFTPSAAPAKASVKK